MPRCETRPGKSSESTTPIPRIEIGGPSSQIELRAEGTQLSARGGRYMGERFSS